MTVLFSVPIDSTGTIEVSSTASKVYLLAFESPPDNRLTTSFNEAFITALDIIESRFPRGVVITTSKISKFYSNGLDLDLFRNDPSFLPDSLYPLFRRLLSYPMPTLALLNGHTFAGGLLVALHHDYRIQNPSKGFLCMNEVLFGAAMDAPLLSIFREKITSPGTYRTLILEGHRFNAQQALKEGITDGLGGLDEALQFINEHELIKKGDAGVYGVLKEEMYRESMHLLSSHQANEGHKAAQAARRQAEKKQQLHRINVWENNSSNSKTKL